MKIKLIENETTELPKDLKINPIGKYEHILRVWNHFTFKSNYLIKDININTDGTIDVQGSIQYPLFNSFFNYKSSLLYFNKVSGFYSCYQCDFTSLEGSPNEVGAYFDCSHNKLTSLEYCPKEVGNYFVCYENPLNNLQHTPETINSDFYCFNCNLTSLIGGPKKVKGDYSCSNNPLYNLVGCPEEVTGEFECYGTQIKFDKEYINKKCKVGGKIYNYDREEDGEENYED